MTEEQHPTLQWLLENGQNLVARNLYAAQITNENKFLPFFSLEISSSNGGEEELVLRSAAARPGSCPTWSICGLQSTPSLEKHYFSHNITVRIFCLLRVSSEPSPANTTKSSTNNNNINTNDNQNNPAHSEGEEKVERALVTEEVFDLRRLAVYKVAGTLSSMVFPVNTVLLAIGDEFFSSSRQSPMAVISTSLENTESRFLKMTAENTRTNHLTDEAQLRAFQAQVEQVSRDLETRMQAFETARDASPAVSKRKDICQRQVLALYLEQRKRELAALRQARERAVQQEQYYQARIEQSRLHFEEYENMIKAHQQRITATKTEIKDKSEQLLKVKFSIEAKQLKLLYELHEIFPIEVRKNECLIRDIEIPNDLSAPAKDDEAVASGLGYVVHLLLLCSKYLEIPLRYQLLYMGSRSLVRDVIRDSSKDPVATYPLFKRGVEKERFEKAVSWLKGNVEFLLRCRGLDYDPSKHFLSNLQFLFDCDSCAKAKA